MASVEEEVMGILKEVVEMYKDVKLVVATDDQGLVIGAYPYPKEKTELLETIGAIFSSLLQDIFDTISVKAPKIAGKIARIAVGMKTRIIEFYPKDSINIIVFRSLESED
ncbi:MAG: hypothetical protein Q6363_003420 [Candidatus Njordarchaeota archaeon]